MKGQLTIGRLAAETGVSADTIRYYESVGLMPMPTRSEAGYRLYSRAEIRRLRLIKRAKLLGLSLGEIKALVDQTFTGSCAHLQRALLERVPVQLAEVERRMAELETLRGELRAVQWQLSGLDASEVQGVVADCPHCPVVEGPVSADALRVATPATA
jgi:DNA-binding transcriptional MerR regulator